MVNFKTQNMVVAEKALVSVSALVLSIGMMVSYSYMSLVLDPAEPLDFNFWNPIAGIATIMNVSIIALIGYNARVNFLNRNLFEKFPMVNVEILYLMCLPTLIVVIITSFLKTIHSIVLGYCYGVGEAIFSFSLSLYFVAVLILLIETNVVDDTGEIWEINFWNYGTVLITITSLLGYSVLNVATEQSQIFTHNVNVNFSDCNISDAFTKKVDDASHYFEPFLWKSSVLFGLTCAIFLFNPLLRHLKHLNNFVIVDTPVTDGERSIPPHKMSLRLLVPISLFVVVLLLCTITNAIMDDLIFSKIYQSLTFVNYFFMITSSIIILLCVKSWDDLAGKKRTFNDILIWITFCGILFHCLAMIVTCIHQLYHLKAFLYWITLFKYILLSVQILVQNILEKLILSKNWSRQSTENHPSVLILLLFMGACNGIMAVSNYTHTATPFILPTDNKFYIRFFIYGFDNLGEIIGTLQRLHACVLFIYLFISMRKET